MHLSHGPCPMHLTLDFLHEVQAVRACPPQQPVSFLPVSLASPSQLQLASLHHRFLVSQDECICPLLLASASLLSASPAPLLSASASLLFASAPLLPASAFRFSCSSAFRFSSTSSSFAFSAPLLSASPVCNDISGLQKLSSKFEVYCNDLLQVNLKFIVVIYCRHGAMFFSYRLSRAEWSCTDKW